MPAKKQPLPEYDLIDMIMHPEKYPQEPPPIAVKIMQLYPDIPEDKRETWYRSDETAKTEPEREEAIRKLTTNIPQAQAVCQALQAYAPPMTPAMLKALQLPLTKVILSAQDLLDLLDGDYPLPDNNAYTRVAGNKELSDLAPKLMLNTEEHILIWTKSFPPNVVKNYGSLSAEFEYFLYSHTLVHYQDWHCDFIHVHPSNSLHGIRDVDNYPYKPVIDALSRAVFAKDSYDHFSYSAYNLASDAIPAGCYIHITKRSEKVGFFQDFENLVSSPK